MVRRAPPAAKPVPKNCRRSMVRFVRRWRKQKKQEALAAASRTYRVVDYNQATLRVHATNGIQTPECNSRAIKSMRSNPSDLNDALCESHPLGSCSRELVFSQLKYRTPRIENLEKLLRSSDQLKLNLGSYEGDTFTHTTKQNK